MFRIRLGITTKATDIVVAKGIAGPEEASLIKIASEFAFRGDGRSGRPYWMRGPVVE